MSEEYVFEDGNFPGLFYLGTEEDARELNGEGGHAMRVGTARLLPDGRVRIVETGEIVTPKPWKNRWIN